MLLGLCRKSLRYQWGYLDHLLRVIDMMWFGVKESFLRTRITRNLLIHLLCHCPVPVIIPWFLLMKGLQQHPLSLQLSLCWFTALCFYLIDLRFVKQIHFVASGVQQRMKNPQIPSTQWAAVAERPHILPLWIKLPFIIYPELIWNSQRNEKWGKFFSQSTPLFICFSQGIALPTKADISANFNLATKVLPFFSPLPAKYICEPLTSP